MRPDVTWAIVTLREGTVPGARDQLRGRQLRAFAGARLSDGLARSDRLLSSFCGARGPTTMIIERTTNMAHGSSDKAFATPMCRDHHVKKMAFPFGTSKHGWGRGELGGPGRFFWGTGSAIEDPRPGSTTGQRAIPLHTGTPAGGARRNLEKPHAGRSIAAGGSQTGQSVRLPLETVGRVTP